MMREITHFSMTRNKAFAVVTRLVSICMVMYLATACGELTGPKSPSTPTNVVATLLTGTSVLVKWTPSPLNDGVVSYSIFRNGTKVGESTTTTFTDTGLPQQQVFKYTVAANCSSGIVSDQSAESAQATVTTLDITPPRVTATSPANGQTAVSSAATVTATFSEAIDPTTINASTFVIRVTNGAVVPGTVTYAVATHVAEFKPTGPLPNPANLTATVTTGVKDLAGNKLAADFSWTFTTRDDSPPTVISTSPAAGATGVSPTAPITVTFSEAMDVSTITAANITLKVTSSGAAVPGTVTYNAATRVATFTPNAPLAQTTGYTLTVSSAVKDLAGNPAGVTRTYTFTTGDTTPPTVLSVSPTNLATNVPVGTAVQITFSEPMLESTINGANILLTNTATATTVPATVTYNAATNVATLTPTAPLAGSTTYSVTVTTGVKDISGNSLVSTFTSVFTTVLVDVTPPTVTSVSPPNGATGVAIATTVQVTFSEPMDSTTISNTTITLRNNTTSALVGATVVYNRSTRVATLTPTSALAFGTPFTVTVTTGVKDVAGNALVAPFPSTFTTVAAPDTTAPTIIARTPATGLTGVPTSVVPTVTFSEAMDTSTINATNIRLTLTSTSAVVPGTVTYNAATNTASFTPTSQLANNTGYTLTVTTGVKDVAGNALAAQSSSTFTTVPDTTAPTINSTRPGNNAPGVARDTTISVTFSEAMDSASVVNPANFKVTVTTGGAAVAGTIIYNTTTHVATFRPSALLAASTNYTVTITTGVKDVAGNPLATNSTFTFTTGP